MSRPDVDPPSGSGIDPTARDPTACKYERVRAFGIDYREFEVAVSRRESHVFPHGG